MPVDFFEKELAALREKYNQTFGSHAVFKRDTRHRVIIAIIHMGLLTKRIAKTKDEAEKRDDIRKFNNTKKTLMTIFSTAEKIIQERRCDDNGNQASRRSGQRSSVG